MLGKMDYEIRKWKPEDAYALSKILNNNKITDNLRDGIPCPYTEVDALNYITEMINSDPNKVFAFAVCCNGKLAGSIGIFRQDNIYYRSAEIGYYLSENYWNKGLATYAIKKACEYVFANSDIIRIFAEPFARNTASRRVLSKTGFVYEGTMFSSAVKNGIVEDTVIYGLLKGV